MAKRLRQTDCATIELSLRKYLFFLAAKSSIKSLCLSTELFVAWLAPSNGRCLDARSRTSRISDTTLILIPLIPKGYPTSFFGSKLQLSHGFFQKFVKY